MAPSEYERLRDILDRLDEFDRRCVILAYFRGRTTSQIATEISSKREAVRQAISRALRTIGLALA